MRLRHVVGGVLVLALAGAAGFAVLAYEPAIDPVTPPERSAFDTAAIARGAELAAIGNCNVCHTAPGGAVLAGGLPIATPFGTIYSTNITPDPETRHRPLVGGGLRALHARGRRPRRAASLPGLPVRPFHARHRRGQPRALRLSDDAPARARAERRRTSSPSRSTCARSSPAGSCCFCARGRSDADPAQSAEWNRGAYLVEGLGHCGACHTPRNRLGAEQRDAHFAGGEAEGWHAYAINAASPAPVPWTADSLHVYLRHGWHAQHGVSRGPMAPRHRQPRRGAGGGRARASPFTSPSAWAHRSRSRWRAPNKSCRRPGRRDPARGDGRRQPDAAGGAGDRAGPRHLCGRLRGLPRRQPAPALRRVEPASQHRRQRAESRQHHQRRAATACRRRRASAAPIMPGYRRRHLRRAARRPARLYARRLQRQAALAGPRRTRSRGSAQRARSGRCMLRTAHRPPPPFRPREAPHGEADGQRARHRDRRRSRHAAALRPARRSRAERRQVRLRPRPVRRLHGAGRRRAGVVLHRRRS